MNMGRAVTNCFRPSFVIVDLGPKAVFERQGLADVFSLPPPPVGTGAGKDVDAGNIVPVSLVWFVGGEIVAAPGDGMRGTHGFLGGFV